MPLTYCSHSFKVNGFKWIWLVTRLCKPPWFLNILLTIHEVAEPHTTSNISSRPDTHPFQKNSSAFTKRDRGVSSHGNSSIKMTFLSALDWRMRSLRSSNASSQFLGSLPIDIPASFNEAHQPNSCSLKDAFASPE